MHTERRDREAQEKGGPNTDWKEVRTQCGSQVVWNLSVGLGLSPSEVWEVGGPGPRATGEALTPNMAMPT